MYKTILEIIKEEKSEERKSRFKAISSDERKYLIRKKMKLKGLVEGSGVHGKPLSAYRCDEISDLIEITRRFPEVQVTQHRLKAN